MELSGALMFLLILIGIGVGLTFCMFHWNKFDKGYEKGEAADPECISRDNPPDEWCKSHWVEKPKVERKRRFSWRNRHA